MARSAAVLAVSSVLVVLRAGSSLAAVPPAPSCKTLKAQATGKYALGALKAFGRNKRSPNIAKLDANLLKARSRLTRAFERAENGGGCATANDAVTIEGKANVFVLDTVANVCPVCGDGNRSGGEACDSADDSVCPGLCLPDCTCAVPGCGNGIIEPGEECDGEALGTCLAEGWACGAPGSPHECTCCGVFGPNSCTLRPCCDPTNWCGFGGPGQGDTCHSCSGPGGICGVDFYGFTAGVCCAGNICMFDAPSFPTSGACQPLACGVPSDCLGTTSGCESGLCCVPAGEVCGSTLIPEPRLQCCGGGLCTVDDTDPTPLVCHDLTCTSASDCPSAEFDFDCENGGCCVAVGNTCAVTSVPSVPELTCCGGASCSKPVPPGSIVCCLDAASACAADEECCSGACNAVTLTCDP